MFLEFADVVYLLFKN